MLTTLNYLIAYDISNDRTRNKISKILEGYGDRVQNSVFELPGMSENTFEKCLKKLEKISSALFEDEDSIRIYNISNYQTSKTIVLGRKKQKPFETHQIYVY